jgi:deoxyribonuclease-4
VGEGTIGLDAIAGVVRAAGAPVIMETPGAKAGDSDDVALLRAVIGRTRPSDGGPSRVG